MLAQDVVVSKSCDVYILSFQPGSSHPQVITQVASHPAERVTRTYISKESNLRLRHGKDSLLSGDSVLSH